MLDGAPRVLACSNNRNAREDWVLWEGSNDRPLDVETVLQKRNGSVTRSDSGADYIRHEGRDIGNILGSDDDEVERRQALRRDVGYGIANWKTLVSQLAGRDGRGASTHWPWAAKP